jgi:hypothetical protein
MRLEFLQRQTFTNQFEMLSRGRIEVEKLGSFLVIVGSIAGLLALLAWIADKIPERIVNKVFGRIM